MAKNNGKWVVATILGIVAVLAFISVQLKKDMTSESGAEEAAEAVSE